MNDHTRYELIVQTACWLTVGKGLQTMTNIIYLTYYTISYLSMSIKQRNTCQTVI